jgi:hypothetical protein
MIPSKKIKRIKSDLVLSETQSYGYKNLLHIDCGDKKIFWWVEFEKPQNYRFIKNNKTKNYKSIIVRFIEPFERKENYFDDLYELLREFLNTKKSFGTTIEVYDKENIVTSNYNFFNCLISSIHLPGVNTESKINFLIEINMYFDNYRNVNFDF